MKVTYTTPCKKKYLAELRAFVKKQLAIYKLPELEANKIVLAIDEACANAIIHGNGCDENKKLTLQIELLPATINIELWDIGPYKPDKNGNNKVFFGKIVGNCIEKKKKGGLGLMLMNTIMDNVSYYQKSQHHICRMQKLIK